MFKRNIVKLKSRVALDLTHLQRFKEQANVVTPALKTTLYKRKPGTDQLPSTFLQGHHCRTCV